MTNVALKAVLLLALPVVAFLGGSRLMTTLSGRQEVELQLREKAEPEDQRPLGKRAWYDRAAVDLHWKALDTKAHSAERLFLTLDLVFPFVYGGALATSLLLAWAALGGGFSRLWVLAPVILTLLADWTENLILLAQLRRYIKEGFAGLEGGWIHVASCATLVKIVCFGASFLLLLVLVGILLFRGLRPGA